MKPTGKLPYFTAKKLAGVLAGEIQCLASVWIPSRFWYQKRPESFDFERWRQEHDTLVQRRRFELEADGYVVSVENQNSFELIGQTARLTGKPDIVATRVDEVLVSDGKTGQQRGTDFWQVVIYMMALPRVDKAKYGGKRLVGEVVYTEGLIQIDAVTEVESAKAFATLRDLARNTAFPTTPSLQSCRWCNIAECTDRVEPTDELPTTTDF